MIFVPRLFVSPTMTTGRDNLALLEFNFVNFSFFKDLYDHFFGQGVDAGDPHAVKSARDLIGVFIELAAGMQDRHDHFQRRDFPALL